MDMCNRNGRFEALMWTQLIPSWPKTHPRILITPTSTKQICACSSAAEAGKRSASCPQLALQHKGSQKV